MEHVIIAEQVVSEALEYTMRCIKQTVDQCPQFTVVKHVQQQQEIKGILEECVRLNTMVERDEQYARRMETTTMHGLLVKVGEVVANVNSSSLLYTAIQGMHQDATMQLEKSTKMKNSLEKSNAKVERDIDVVESHVSVLEDRIQSAMRQHRWQQGQIRHVEEELNSRISRIPRLMDSIREIDEAIHVEEDRIQDCSQSLLPLAHSMIVHAQQEADVWDAKNRKYAAQIDRTMRELNEMRLYIHQIRRGLEEQIIHRQDMKSTEPSSSSIENQQQCEYAIDRLYEMLKKRKEKVQSRTEDMAYAQMAVSHGIRQLDQAIAEVESKMNAGKDVLLQLEREYECICRDNNTMHAFCMSLSAIQSDTRDEDSMQERKNILQDNIRHLKEDIVRIENTMYDRLLQYQSLQDTAQDASNTTGTQVEEEKIPKTKTSVHRITKKIQYIARIDAKEAHAVQRRLPRLVSSMVSRIGSNAAQL